MDHSEAEQASLCAFAKAVHEMPHFDEKSCKDDVSCSRRTSSTMLEDTYNEKYHAP